MAIPTNKEISGLLGDIECNAQYIRDDFGFDLGDDDKTAIADIHNRLMDITNSLDDYQSEQNAAHAEQKDYQDTTERQNGGY